jgi:ER lumen protein retaining receptor
VTSLLTSHKARVLLGFSYRNPRSTSCEYLGTLFHIPPTGKMFCSALMNTPTPAKSLEKVLPTHVIVIYMVFAIGAFAVYHHVAEQEFSSVLTMAVIVQALGVVLICVQVATSGSVAGISARGLTLDAIAVALRLSSTVWLNGYLPTDSSGDILYQVTDACSLCMLLFLLRCVMVTHRNTYQEDADSFSVGPVVLANFALAAIFHADMDDNPLFDTLWMTGLFTGVVAVLPQLWLIMKTGGRAEALTSHYIAAMALSRILSGWFMWEAREDITSMPWVEGVQHGIIVILIAHFLHLVLLCDFMYFYVVTLAQKGFRGSVQIDLPQYV